MGKILLPANLSEEEARAVMSTSDGEQIIVRDRANESIMGRMWNIEADIANKLVPNQIHSKGIVVECFTISSEKDRGEMVKSHSFPGLFNIRFRTLKEFAEEEDPNLDIINEDLSNDVSNVNWELLSSTAHFYATSMRRAIAMRAYLIQKEVLSLIEILQTETNVVFNKEELQGENFNFTKARMLLELFQHSICIIWVRIQLAMNEPKMFVGRA